MSGHMTRKKVVTWEELSFPENYYESMDAMERYEILSKELETDKSPQNELRMAMWEERYGKYRGEKPEVDHYIRLWLDFHFASEKKGSFLGKGSAKKALVSDLKSFGHGLIRGKEDWAKEILYQEMKNLSRFYLSLCMTDKTYRSKFLGILRMTDDDVMEKMQKEVYEVAVATLKTFGLEKEYEIFSRATLDAYREDYPENCQVLERLLVENK